MRICLHFDPSRLLRWHLRLAHALAEVPNSQVSRSFAPLSYPLPAGSRLLFELERLIYGFRGLGAMDRMESALLSLPVQQAGHADVVIDLSGEETSPKAPRVLRPFFNGVPSEIGIMAALANDQDLLVELHDTARPSNPWMDRPASQDREVFSASLDASLSCATALILKALHHGNGSFDIDGVSRAKSKTRSSGPMSTLGFTAGKFAANIARLFNKLGGATRFGRSAGDFGEFVRQARSGLPNPSKQWAPPSSSKRLLVDGSLIAGQRTCRVRDGIAQSSFAPTGLRHHTWN